MAPGTIVGRRYRLTERIARGGMSEVWLAVDAATGEEVIAKTPRGVALQRSDLRAMFEREAKILSRIASPYVTRFYGYFTEGKQPFIVCERLVGETLAERLKRSHVLTLADLAPIVEQVLTGLGDAHAQGVVHRDLSPDNVFLCGKPEVAKIIDFGIGKPLDESEPLTPQDATMGSLPFMPPEQWLDPSKVDARADLYAVGTIIFLALTGTLPFPEKNAMRLLTLKRDFEAPTIAETTRAPYPAEISAFVAKALARAREARFYSAADMLKAWREIFQQSDTFDVDAALITLNDEGGDTTATMTHTRRPRQ